MIIYPCKTPLVTDSTGLELLKHGTDDFPVQAYENNINVRHIAWHWHEEIEVAWIMSGTCTIGVGGKKLDAAPGNIYFFNTGTMHTFIAKKGETCILRSVLFHPRLIGSIDSVFWQKYVLKVIDDRGLYFRELPQSDPEQAQVYEGLMAAWDNMDTEHPGYEFTVRSALSRLIVVLGQYSSSDIAQPSEKSIRDNDRMKLMLQFVQQNFADEITVDDIAASALISKSECIRCFHSTIGTTPIAYVRSYRLHRATQQLIASNRPVSDIAYDCGFREMSYFSRAFKARYDCTPSEYRARHGNEPVEMPEIEEIL